LQRTWVVDHWTNLEHLDESNAKIEIGQVSADQAQTEEEANGDDSPEVNPSGHLDRLATVKEGGVASKDLGHDGRKREVVGRQDDGIS
jgi:hypothetical protein